MNLFQKFLTISLAFLLTVSATLASSFSDVPDEDPQSEAIEFLRLHGVSKNKDLFYPKRPVGLSEFLAMAMLSAGLEEKDLQKNISSRFELPLDAWYTKFIAKADELGVLKNYQNGGLISKKPNYAISRGEAVELALNIFGGVPIVAPDEEFGFKDLRSSHRLARSIFWAVKWGVIDPISDEEFGVTKRITRAEAAELIFKLHEFKQDGGAAVKFIIESSGGSSIPNIELFDIVWAEVQSRFLFEENIDEAAMIQKAIKGAIEALGDPNSAFFTPEEKQSFESNISGEIDGIGIYISKNEEGKIVVIAPIKGSPAKEAGILPGDIIKAIDEKFLEGFSVDEAAKLIRGERGTEVKLTILREEQELEFSIKRALIEVDSVELEFKNNVAIVSISQFGADTAQEFEAVAEEIISRNPRGIVLDLRNNGGGLVDAAVKISEYFLDKGSIVARAKYRQEAENSEYRTEKEPTLNTFKTMILINKGSASASEIVAAAFQDYGKAEIVGEKSFGKGTMQEINFFTDGTMLKLTIAHWLSPKEQEIEKNGVTPDIEAVDNEETKNSDEALDYIVRLF